MLSKKTKIWTLFMGVCIINLSCSNEENLYKVVCGESCIVDPSGESFEIIEEPFMNGQCQSGLVVCGGSEPACIGHRGASPETCDYIDNDCNGVVDDGLDFEVGVECNFDESGNIIGPKDLQGTCSNGLSVCALSGKVACEGVVNPTDEICDGLDNDCDGMLDEAPQGAPEMDCPTIDCLSQDPICREGDWTCPSEVALGDEICDGLDNDCDGLIDEDDPHDPLFENGDYAYEGDIGETANPPCRPGVRQCVDGVETIVGMVTPRSETCDGIDNNCDGIIDNDLIDTFQDQYTGPPETLGVGLCSPSAATCVDGALVHTDEVLPRVEDCEDTLDNDCDGFINEATTEAVTQSFVLVLDISGSMSYYLHPMMSALCSWSSASLLGGSMFNIVVVGNSEEDSYYPDVPRSLTNGFVPAASVCDALFGEPGYQGFESSGSEHQFWGVEIATQYAWPPGMSKNVIIFSDEGLQMEGIRNSWVFSVEERERFIEHCQAHKYRLITYSDDYLAWWEELSGECGGVTHQIVADQEILVGMLLDDFVGNCADPALFQ